MESGKFDKHFDMHYFKGVVISILPVEILMTGIKIQSSDQDTFSH